jgi:fructokinase
MGYRLGIDLGGTKIELAAYDAQGAERLRQRIDTPAGRYDATVEAIVRLVHDAERELGETASVGIGMPGSASLATGLMRNANSTCLNGRDLQGDLQRALARPIRMANDANCFALAEAIEGAARDGGAVFGVILGTGVGGGIVISGRVLQGANAIAGEWGHNPLPLPRDEDLPLRPCYCGRAGCIETYLSGPALEDEHARRHGARVTPAEMARGADAGDTGCESSLARYEERLARALAGVINILDPDAIVLGGGLSNIRRLYDRVPAIWGRYVFSDEVRTRLLPPLLGDSAGVRGAAWLWNDGVDDKPARER